jgi:hypothetical protein
MASSDLTARPSVSDPTTTLLLVFVLVSFAAKIVNLELDAVLSKGQVVLAVTDRPEDARTGHHRRGHRPLGFPNGNRAFRNSPANSSNRRPCSSCSR